MIMLKLRSLELLMHERQIPNYTELAKKMNISQPRLGRIRQKPLAGQSHSLTLKSLNKLCEVLKCTPSDIIEYIPDAPG